MPLVKLLISAALVWWCLRVVDVSQLLATLGRIHLAALAACLAFMVAHTALCAWRWHLVCRRLGLGGPEPRNALRWMALSVMLSQVLPSTVGGDAYRVGALARHEGLAAAMRSVILDRVTGLWMLAVLGGAASVVTVRIAGWVPEIVAAGALVFGFVVALPAAALLGVKWQALAKEAGALWTMLRSPPVLVTSIGIHVMTVAAVIALSLGLQPGGALWWQMALLTPAAMLAAAIPVSLGGWGVREAALVVGASAFGIPQSEALAVSVAYGLVLLATGMLGTLLWAALPGKTATASPAH